MEVEQHDHPLLVFVRELVENDSRIGGIGTAARRRHRSLAAITPQPVGRCPNPHLFRDSRCDLPDRFEDTLLLERDHVHEGVSRAD